MIAALAAMTASLPAEARSASNRLATNRLATNRLATNRLAANRLASNRLAANKLASNRLASNALVTNDRRVSTPAADGASLVSGNARAGDGSVLGVAVIELADGTQLRR